MLSSSANLGASRPLTRAVPFFAESQAIRICEAKGSMSGAKRREIKASGVKPRFSALAAPLFRQWDRLVRPDLNTGRVALVSVMVMKFILLVLSFLWVQVYCSG